jgi:hypothetical protein
MVEFSVADRLAIYELIGLHGHLMDDGELSRLDELFTPDVIYDLSEYGAGELLGIEAVRAAALEAGDRNPVGHHVTNIVVSVDGDQVRARSKGIGILADGRCGSVVYEDQLRRGDEGWRISRRQVTPRRQPLGGL